ncbi:hypothetical protein Leryth_007844 [Lithospermum erythrorhizon]|nr:hypothetical protein Leryth_007844 [Lithospermum erythrorhizon]
MTIGLCLRASIARGLVIGASIGHPTRRALAILPLLQATSPIHSCTSSSGGAATYSKIPSPAFSPETSTCGGDIFPNTTTANRNKAVDTKRGQKYLIISRKLGAT